jgi:MYXO-CTERM domain-containing protein
MRSLVWVGVVGCLVFGPSKAAADEVRVFILAGQSNMAGLGDGSMLTGDLAEQRQVWYDHHNPDARNGGSYADATSTDWEPLAPMGTNELYGPELTFGAALQEAFPNDRIAIVKMSQGGTNIIEHWGRGLGPDPDGNTYKSQLYHALLGTLDSADYSGATALAYPNEMGRLDRAIARLDADGVDYAIAALIWMQGENEASWSAAFQYDVLLADFVAAIRQDLGIPDLPVVVGRVSDNLYSDNGGPVPADRSDNVTAVRAAQVAWAEADANARWIDTDDFVAVDDGWHFDSAGYQTMGRRMADAYLELAPAAPGADAGASNFDAGAVAGGTDAGSDTERPSGGCQSVGGDTAWWLALLAVLVLAGTARRRTRPDRGTTSAPR